MSNKGLFKKKKVLADEKKIAPCKPVSKPAKATSAFSFKASDKTPSTKTTTAKTTEAEQAKPKTVDDEVANLLGEGLSAKTAQTQAVADFETVLQETQDDDKIESDFVKVEGEIVSALEAPKEFAHPDQPDTYDNPVLARIKESLQLVKANINDKEIVGDAIYNLMQQMKDDPKLADMLEAEDYGIMARGLRESYHVVVTVKEDKIKKKTVKTIKVDEVTALLGEIMV